MLPGQGDGQDIEIGKGQGKNRYSLLLFLRDLEAGDRKLKEFVEGLQNAPGVMDDSSTMAAVLEAALQIKNIDYDYINPATPYAKKRRLNLYGNDDAAAHVAEHNELTTLARTVWTDPDDLRDVIGDLYHMNLRDLEEGTRYTLDDIFDWSRSWSEVRFRFLYQALRDVSNLGIISFSFFPPSPHPGDLMTTIASLLD